jgi:hypothetical protein
MFAVKVASAEATGADVSDAFSALPRAPMRARYIRPSARVERPHLLGYSDPANYQRRHAPPLMAISASRSRNKRAYICASARNYGDNDIGNPKFLVFPTCTLLGGGPAQK